MKYKEVKGQRETNGLTEEVRGRPEEDEFRGRKKKRGKTDD